MTAPGRTADTVIVGVASLAAAVGSAYLSGDRPAGSVWLLVPIGAVATLVLLMFFS